MVKKQRLFIAGCIIPGFLLTIIFVLIPTIQTFLLSFTNSTGLSATNTFVGLENYQYLVTDKNFILSLKNTFKLILVVPPITLFLGLIFAFILTQGKLKERGFYRTIFFFPSIISLTVIGVVWSFMFHPNLGVVNSLLTQIGLEEMARPWLGDSKTALWAVATTLIWQAVGYYMVMYIAAIDGISTEIYEAATIDGASKPKQFWLITLPLLKDIIGITLVLAMSGTMNLSFVIVSVMTGGGPAGSSSVLLQYMNQQAFTNGNFGYAMSISVITLIIAFVLSFISRKLTSQSEGR